MKADYAGIVASGYFYPIRDWAMLVPKYEYDTRATYKGRVVAGIRCNGISYAMVYEDDSRSKRFPVAHAVELEIYKRVWEKVA